jgi:hypothetical protein
MRSVRKGTRSCWACRRRKVRCTFADPSDSVCTGCRRRSIRCVPQELPDDAGSDGIPVGARLSRVEALVEQLIRRLDDCDAPDLSPSSPIRLGLTPDMRSFDLELPESSSVKLPGNRALGSPSQSSGSNEDILQALRDAWPSRQDLDIILSIPVPTSRLFHGVIFTSYSTFTHSPLPLATDLLQMPTLESHPATVARRLLLLSTYLQNIPSIHHDLARLGVGYEQTIHRVFDTATCLVTSHDHLIESVEGVECLMIESMYHNNAGNLRRAWLVLRKAIGIAQLLGLDRRSLQATQRGHAAIKTIDPEMTGPRVDPGRMWFRLIASDRYLSLMLGLPEAGADEDRFLTAEALEDCTAMEKMERMIVAAGGRILRRNRHQSQATPYDYHGDDAETDIILQKAAALMPPKWWLMPSPEDGSSGFDETDTVYDEEGKELRMTIRLMNQMAFQHLLIRLHLPYLLRRHMTSHGQYEYSRTTAVNASRELLTRYVSFRLSSSVEGHNSSSQSGPSPPYCRGVDFLAFVASIVLCLVSIDSRQSCQQSGLPCHPFSAHQRLGDRGLMEHTLDTMERMARCNGDTIATRVADILRPLLAIEADLTNSAVCTLSAKSEDYEQKFECGGSVGDGGDLHIRIPYLGTIDIDIGDGEPGDATSANDWALQGVALALFEGLIQGTEDTQQIEIWHT